MAKAQFELRYWQGSFQMKEEFPSQLAAIARAVVVMERGVSRNFAIHNEGGNIVVSESEIRHAVKSKR